MWSEQAWLLAIATWIAIVLLFARWRDAADYSPLASKEFYMARAPIAPPIANAVIVSIVIAVILGGVIVLLQ